jgi:hypothetical protein
VFGGSTQTNERRMPGRDHQLNNDLTDIAVVIKSLPATA